MRTGLITCCLAVASALTAVPATAAPARAATSLPPACVVVNGPSGASVQVGYAPDGPTSCTTLP